MGGFFFPLQNDSRLSSPSALHNSSMSACQYFINFASSQKCCIQTFENSYTVVHCFSHTTYLLSCHLKGNFVLLIFSLMRASDFQSMEAHILWELVVYVHYLNDAGINLTWNGFACTLSSYKSAPVGFRLHWDNQQMGAYKCLFSWHIECVWIRARTFYLRFSHHTWSKAFKGLF